MAHKTNQETGDRDKLLSSHKSIHISIHGHGHRQWHGDEEAFSSSPEPLHRHLLLWQVRVRPEAELAGAGHGGHGRRRREEAPRGGGGGGVRRHRRRAVRPPGRVPLPRPARAPPLRAPDAAALPQVRLPRRLRLRRQHRRHQAAAVPHQDPGAPPGRLPGRNAGGRDAAVASMISEMQYSCAASVSLFFLFHFFLTRFARESLPAAVVFAAESRSLESQENGLIEIIFFLFFQSVYYSLSFENPGAPPTSATPLLGGLTHPYH